MPEDVMLKISYAIVSFCYVSEGKLRLLVEGHLMNCFYENLSETIISDDFI